MKSPISINSDDSSQELSKPEQTSPKEDAEISKEVENKTDDTRRDHLGRLPLEVIEMILKGLDDVECACIGVTSRVFYTTYKRLHKNATKLDAPYMGKTAGRPIMLYVFLQDWVGDGYRIFRKYSESGPPRLVFKKLTVLPVLKDDRPSLPVAETSLVAATKFLQRREGSEQNDPIAPRVHV